MENMTLTRYGVAGKDYNNAKDARGDTYTQLNGGFPSTNLACADNPFKDEVFSAKYVLDLGCGVGRNLSWVMNNTTANYIGLDPNKTMTKFFWDVQRYEGHNVDSWQSRVTLCSDFSEISSDIKFDYVITTFVLQHLGYRYNTRPNLDDITQQVLSKMNKGCVWFLLEHDSEEDWIGRWSHTNNIELSTYIRSYKGIPELTDRDVLAPNGGHHLMIYKHE